MSAVYLLQSPEENFLLLQQQLSNRAFKEVHLFFLSAVEQDVIRRIAECDEHDLV